MTTTSGAPQDNQRSTEVNTQGLHRPLSGTSSLIARGFRSVWHAGRLPTVLLVLVGVSSAVAITVQLLAVRALLHGIADHGAPHWSALNLLPWIILIVFLSVLSLVLAAASAQLRRYLGQLVVRSTSRSMLDVTTGVPLEAFESAEFFNHGQRVDANSLEKPLDIVGAVVHLLSSGLTIIGLAGVIATTEPLLLPVLAFTAVPAYISNRVAARLEFSFAVAQSPLNRERVYIGSLLKSRDAAKEVRAYALAPVLRGVWEQHYDVFITALKQLSKRRVFHTLIAAIVSAIVLGVSMYILVASIHDRNSLVAAATALVAMRLLATQLQSAAGGMTGLHQARLFLDDLDAFLANEHEPLLIQRTDEIPASGAPTHIELDHVSFFYPGTSRLSLENISMEIRPGEIVALVGENGSGKTTLAKILAQLLSPTSGTVRWQGRDTRLLPADLLRSRISVVFQDYLRYDFTATQNIAFGRPDKPLDMPAVKAAARHAGAASFLEGLPDGYETVLSKVYAQGSDLSVGQWQRVALARAFYRDADLIIFDEPTSSLDPRAEQELFEKMRELFAGRTVLLISHRFSTVRSADRILVMRSGRIIESGTHDQLIANDGLYQELFSIQAEAYLGAY